jgi:broad specificity phosphatase PhoE
MSGAGPCRIFLVALGADGDGAAARLQTALEKATIDATYRSDSAGARESAAALGGARDVPVLVDPRLRDLDATRGESVAGALERAWPAFCELARAHQEGTVLVVSHPAIVQALLCSVTEAGEPNYQRFAVRPLGLTMVEVGTDGRGVLRALNANLDPNAIARKAPATRVLMIRHGHAMSVEKGAPAYSHNPIPLSRLGEEQAMRVAAALSTVQVDGIFSSDIVRARQTAEFCGRALGLEVVTDRSLRELALGEFEGMTLERVHASHPAFIPWLEVVFRNRFPSADFHHPADLRFPNGQSVLDVHDSSLAGVLRILETERGRTILLVSHGWVLQPLICHIVGADPQAYYRFTLPTATVAMAEVEADGRGVLEIFNGGVALEDLPKLTGADGRLADVR